MKNNEILIRDICIGFNQRKGKASAYCFPPFKFEEVLYNMIVLFRRKRPTDKIIILVDLFATRLKIVEYLRNAGTDTENITIFSENYVNRSKLYSSSFTIFVNIFDITTIRQLEHSSTFTFALFTKNLMNNEFTNQVKELLPEINVTVDNNSAVVDRINSPVEEVRVEVELTDTEAIDYAKANNFITESMSVFGTIENADKCRIGDIANNISAAQFREELAERNGWSPNLDCSLEFNKRLDDIYNPNELYTRAITLYNIMANRRNIVTNCKTKLDIITDIVKNNPNKKILIISKHGDFANDIANTIKNNALTNCGICHDSIESQYLTDERGEIIKYKSGAKQGEYKLFGSTFISNYFLDEYKNNNINLLSVKFNFNKDADIHVDIIIFTTPLFDTLEEFILKHNKVDFSDPIKVYQLYCVNTIEYTKLKSRIVKSNVKLVEDEKNIMIDDTSGEIVL